MLQELRDELAEGHGVHLVPVYETLPGPGIDHGDVRPVRDRVKGHVALAVFAVVVNLPNGSEVRSKSPAGGPAYASSVF